jgi:hypothetical protein
VNIFFLLPDIPMTFIGEHDGHSYRTKTVNMMQKVTFTKETDKKRLSASLNINLAKSYDTI